jgi:hypothetical protein
MAPFWLVSTIARIPRPTRSVKVVAGARNHLYRTRFLWSLRPHN